MSSKRGGNIKNIKVCAKNKIPIEITSVLIESRMAFEIFRMAGRLKWNSLFVTHNK